MVSIGKSGEQNYAGFPAAAGRKTSAMRAGFSRAYAARSAPELREGKNATAFFRLIMQKTPKSMRLQIAIFGRTNVGKSSVLNMISGQDVAITSPVPGTTTDVVEKSMELLPVGPVVFLDTGGLDDGSELGVLRIGRTKKIFDRADVALLVTESGIWGECEEAVAAAAREKGIPLISVVNKTDTAEPRSEYLAMLEGRTGRPVLCSTISPALRERTIKEIKDRLLEITAAKDAGPRTIVGDLVKPGETAVLIIPVDKEAPKGRIILPQVQVMRDLLDHGSMFLTVTENEYPLALSALSRKPALTVCDSQVVDLMVKGTPRDVSCTTFSILFARFKGELDVFAAGAAAIRGLKPGDRILVAEGCSHHPIEDDIGRVKLPKWLAEFVGGPLKIDTVAGRDFPSDLSQYRLILQCGGCMLTRKEVLNRIGQAGLAGVPIT
ncbi:MAG: [FeFe] hydrogenase H-cluster maturation GTPase HydF, partial [Lentisphaerae bacterium GWF2_52_8]